MSKFDRHAAAAVAICTAVLIIAGIVMAIAGESSSGTFATRTGGIQGGTLTSAGVIALATVLAGIFLALIRGGRKKGDKKKK